MESEPLVLIRHSEPNKYDHAEQGTICKVIINHEKTKIYRQISNNPEFPEWECIE